MKKNAKVELQKSEVSNSNVESVLEKCLSLISKSPKLYTNIFDIVKISEDNKGTQLQKLVFAFIDSYCYETFIEMIIDCGDVGYWEVFDIENASDKECIDALEIMASMFNEWNNA